VNSSEQLLKTLTEAHGVPGYETEIRSVLRQYFEPLGELTQDKLGSLICRQPGKGPKVMLAGHMDEVGFMTIHITKDGYLKFVQLGGWWDQVLLGHRVTVKTRNGDVTGVVGAKPPHIVPLEERKKVVLKRDMYIDIGATSLAEVEEAGVRIGDPIVPQGDFEVLAGAKTYLAKAFDDRLGCALVLEILQHFAEEPAPNQLYGVATVMEEVGLRGAITSTRAIDPDVAIILEVDIAGDVPGVKPEQSRVKLGGGPSVLLYDSKMIPNLKLRDLVMDTAEEEGIPYQASSYSVGGSTDGAVIHIHGTGVPSIVLAVPARHIHSHGSIIHKDDYENALKLITAVIKKLDQKTVSGFTS
jgi:endoglucanase